MGVLYKFTYAHVGAYVHTSTHKKCLDKTTQVYVFVSTLYKNNAGSRLHHTETKPPEINRANLSPTDFSAVWL